MIFCCKTRWVNSILTRFLSIVSRFSLNREDFKNVAWLTAEKVVRVVALLIAEIVLARALGLREFGLLSYVLALVVMVAPIAIFGLEGIVIREGVKSSSRLGELIFAAVVVRLITAIVAFASILFITSFLHPHDKAMEILIAVGAIAYFMRVFDVLEYWCQTTARFSTLAAARIVGSVSGCLAKIILISVGAPLIFLVSVLSFEIFITAVVLIFVYLKAPTKATLKASYGTVLYLFKEGAPLMLSAIAVIIYMKIDMVMIGQLLGSEAVGIYAAAARVSEVAYFFPMVVMSAMLPKLVFLRDRQELEYKKTLMMLFRWGVWGGCGIAIVTVLLSRIVISALYGVEYEKAVPILQLHVWATPFVFLGVVQSAWNIVEHETTFALVRTLIGALLNVLLNLLWIPVYGVAGAALATVISYASAAFILNVLTQKTRAIMLLQIRAIFFRSI